LITVLALALGVIPVRSEPQAAETPDFTEVFNVIREHLPDTSESELNRAAVQGLLAGLGAKVTLVPKDANAVAGGETRLLSRTNLFDGHIAYLRIAQVKEGLANAVRDALADLGGTNDLKGLVLDLRFATGDDYSAVATTADLFVKSEKPLLDWGQGLVQSKEKADALTVPVATLVNKQTAASAEALAAVLRETGTGLILGSQTAGEAMIAQDYPLKTGQRLRIATAPIRLGDGSLLSDTGVKPDIQVEVAPLAEQSYYADAFKEFSKANPAISLGATNRTATTNRARRPFNEAELVRERKQGTILDSDPDGLGAEPEKPIVRDPVLVRALDVLKGLVVVRQSHS
jgi:hypothetical protein